MAAFHEAYMRQLLQADLVVPISDWSAKDLSCFLAEHEGVDAAYLPRISPTLLPAEVCDEDRVTYEYAVKKVIESRRRSEEHTSELQSLMRISYAVFFLHIQRHNIIL